LAGEEPLVLLFGAARLPLGDLGDAGAGDALWLEMLSLELLSSNPTFTPSISSTNAPRNIKMRNPKKTMRSRDGLNINFKQTVKDHTINQ
jgi:hypothetical protein